LSLPLVFVGETSWDAAELRGSLLGIAQGYVGSYNVNSTAVVGHACNNGVPQPKSSPQFCVASRRRARTGLAGTRDDPGKGRNILAAISLVPRLFDESSDLRFFEFFEESRLPTLHEA
jgi:hypothetical protein